LQYFYQRGNSQLTLSSGSSAAIGPSFPGYSYVFSQGTNIRVVLDALASVTNVEVISSPQLLVLNNQAAMLQVGDQVPIVAQQAVSTLATGAPLVNSVQYQSTGVILRVTPRVNQGGMVMMDISQEVSDVASTTTSSIDSPTIKQRKIESTVAVRDNETVALGGLIMEGSTRGRSGIPVLQDIPVLGQLFSTTSKNAAKTELMVLITPHVIDSMQKARAATEELQRKLPALQVLFDRAR
jgi:general secretion pathway protein D